MTNEIGFNRQKYIKMQSKHITRRRHEIAGDDGRLYLEMGGRLFNNYHASQALLGFTPGNKIAMLRELKDEIEILVCVSALDLQRQKIRADLGITCEDDALRLADVFRESGFLVKNVAMTRLESDNVSVLAFKERLEHLRLKVARHHIIPGYPTGTQLVLSDKDLGCNDYVELEHNLIMVIAPGPDSGKLATCLSQVYHDHQRGVNAHYAKFETFPVWNLPLEYPVNLAYEVATTDLDDINLISPYHLATYGKQVTSYNRNMETFPLPRTMLEQIAGSSPYQSPTDMGMNIAGYYIQDDAACQEVVRQEIIRRYYRALVEEAKESRDGTMLGRIALIMAKTGASTQQCKVVGSALEVKHATGQPGSTLELHDGTIIRGKASALLGCSVAMVLNALEYLAGIDPKIDLLSRTSIEPIQTPRTEHLGSRNPRLHTDEVPIALSVSAAMDPNARATLDKLKELEGCNIHTTTILGSVDEGIFHSLGVLVTSEPKFQHKSSYRKHQGCGRTSVRRAPGVLSFGAPFHEVPAGAQAFCRIFGWHLMNSKPKSNTR